RTDVGARNNARLCREPYHALSRDDLDRLIHRRAARRPARRARRIGRARRHRDRRHCRALFRRAADQGDAPQMKKLAASKQLTDDLVAASRILPEHGVLDAYGHVSARSDKRREHFIMSRSRAPALVSPADLIEWGADSEAAAGDKR